MGDGERAASQWAGAGGSGCAPVPVRGALCARPAVGSSRVIHSND